MSAIASLPRLRLFPMDDAEFVAALAVAKAKREHHRERMLRWRSHLQTRVVAVSPALIDMAELRGIDLGRAAKRLRPPVCWPGAMSDDLARWEDVWPSAPSPRRAPGRFGCRPGTTGAVRAQAVRRGDPDGGFHVAVDGRCLAGCARVGKAQILTLGGLLQIWFRASLPETVMAAAVGERVDRLIGHPVVTGRDYRIVSVTETNSMTVVEAETGLVPFDMPWPELGRPNDDGGPA